MRSWSLNVFSLLGVFLISVKPLTTENTENKTTPKICKITVFSGSYLLSGGGGGKIRQSEKSCKEEVCSIKCFP